MAFSLLSEICIWDSDKSYSEILTKEQSLEKRYDALYTHPLIWNKIKMFVIFFKSTATEGLKA